MKRLLTGRELAKLDLVDADVAASATLRTSKLVPPTSDGMTIGRTIIVRPGKEESLSLLAHELVHVEQWRRQGAVGFLRGYLGSYARNLARLRNHRAAYLAIPAEIEARRRTLEWMDQRELS